MRKDLVSTVVTIASAAVLVVLFGHMRACYLEDDRLHEMQAEQVTQATTTRMRECVSRGGSWINDGCISPRADSSAR